MADAADRPQRLESEVRGLQLKEEDSDVDMETIAVAASVKQEGAAQSSGPRSSLGTPLTTKGQSKSPSKRQSAVASPDGESDTEETIGGGVTLKLEPGKPPKLARSTSHKVEKRPPQLFADYEDKTAEAKAAFDVLSACTYANKHLGSTEHALECDCAEEWDAASRTNNACGEDSDCINRATKMECVGDCGCGTACQNQRFQRRQFANVSVIKTEKKGYGLRANATLHADQFIFEYIGEVIGEASFRRRMTQYDEDGIKHFYFMSLTKGEFVDATKKGNLGRFCNHSCNPNCYVDKWVVGDKLRMGIFAQRKIQPGEELVFNYNVDRYGAEPQPCYCGEPNCTGYIGGKTQTERATKLSNAIIEALGIDDADAWDTAVAKKPRKKKMGEDDEEYVNNVEPRGLDEEGVNKVMSSLMQCKEKWIAVKLLTRIQRANDDKVRNKVVRFHGYRILKTALSNFSDDVNVCLQILDILDKMPRLTRNKIQDSNIEEAVKPLASSEDERVASLARSMMNAWSQLEIAYRIPRLKRDLNAIPDRKQDRFDRRDQDRRRTKSRSRSKSPERIQAPTGPRNIAPIRRPPPHRFRPPPPMGGLPPGWFEASAANGSVYYYNHAGATTWQRPTVAAVAAPPPPPLKAVTDQEVLQNLIKDIISSGKEPAKQQSTAATPIPTPKKERKEDKWRSLPEEKQKKLYEGALQPHIMHVVGKFKNKLAKEGLKRWAKEFAKQMVESDFKKKRVEDPNKVSDKRAKDVKKHAQAFFEKAVKKKEAADAKKAGKKAMLGSNAGERSTTPDVPPPTTAGSPMPDAEDGTLSDDEMDISGEQAEVTPAESLEGLSALKRRRDEREDVTMEDVDAVTKKMRTESVEAPPPPPPPPPPAGLEAEGSEFATSTGAEIEDGDLLQNGTSAGNEMSAGFSIKGAAGLNGATASANGTVAFHSVEPMQTATPPSFTDSPKDDQSKKALGKSGFMHPDRMRQLGIMDGASD